MAGCRARTPGAIGALDPGVVAGSRAGVADASVSGCLPAADAGVAGGRLDGRTVVLSHVPTFEVGGTYVVSAYANERLYASPVVGTEQGAFREAIEETTGSALLVDAEGRGARAADDRRALGEGAAGAG